MLDPLWLFRLLMSLDDLVGIPLGPFTFRATRERSAAFVEVTGDDDTRWVDTPPPGFVAAPMFAATAPFLRHEEVVEESLMVLHTGQRFQWHKPFSMDADYRVEAVLARVRRRGSLAFASLHIDILRPGGGLVASSASAFLMSPEGEAAPSPEEAEPAPDARRSNSRPTLAVGGLDGDGIPDLPKSASRADLIRYAAAAGDWNPIHWDHDSAVAAGLPGVICHGLLMAAWIAQAAGQGSPGTLPLREARVRFRHPLRPAAPAIVKTAVSPATGGIPTMTCELQSAGTALVTATVIARSE